MFQKKLLQTKFYFFIQSTDLTKECFIIFSFFIKKIPRIWW